MNLRITSSSEPTAGGSAPRWLLVLVIGAMLLLVLAPGATGGAGDYPEPLYLTNAASTNVPASKRLQASGGPGALAAPTVSVQAGSGMTIGSYTYLYTLVDPTGGETAPSLVSATATTSSGNQHVVVSGLPATGRWRLYRRRSTFYFFVAEQTDTSSYTDSTADPPSATVLPQAQNRLATASSSTCTASTCGWLEFVPGIPITSTTANGMPSTTAPTAPSGKGWMVDDSGSVHFAQGDWTFSVQTKNGGASTSGTAHLVVGMWKVTTAGAAVGAPIIDPATAGEETGTNLIDTTNAAKTVTHAVANVPAFSLASDERLYVQFWRRQTVPYVNNFNNDSRIITLFAFDGVGAISHPAVSTLPAVPTLSAPADGSFPEPATPLLAATFTDPDPTDTGVVEFRVCTTLVGSAGSDCTDTVASGSSSPVANGGLATWTVSPALARGAYWWQARAQDAVGGQSAWSATRSFVVDQVPLVPTLSAPSDGSVAEPSTPVLEAGFDDPDVGDSGIVEFRVCTTLVGGVGSDCADTAANGTSGSVGNGTTATWTVSPAIVQGTYWWQARAQDALGAQSAWSSTRTFVVDEAPLDPTLRSPANGAYSATGSPVLQAGFADPDGDNGVVNFRVCTTLVGGAGSDCADTLASGSSPSVASGADGAWAVSPVLAHGTFYWQAAAADPSGASSGWSPTRRLTVNLSPRTPALTSPLARAWVRTGNPVLRGLFADSDRDDGTVRFRVCTEASPAGSRCANRVAQGTSATVADGAVAGWRVPVVLRDRAFHWQARSLDSTGEWSRWSATRRLNVAKALIRVVSPVYLDCAVGSRLTTRLRLGSGAEVRALFQTHGRLDYVKRFGSFGVGIQRVKMRIPWTLERPTTYWVAWQAHRPGETSRSWMRIDLRPLRLGEVNPPPCAAS